MQGYMYSVFSIAAIAVHLIFNFRLLTGRGEVTAHGARYRGFLMGVLAYYIADATWGMLAGLGWLGCLYVETMGGRLAVEVKLPNRILVVDDSPVNRAVLTASRFRRLPVVAVTADTEYDGDPRSGLFDGILLKPLTYDKLMDVLTASGCG